AVNYIVMLVCLVVGLNLSPAREDALPVLTTIAIFNVFVVIAVMTSELTRRTESLLRQLHSAASTDVLTGLPNRAFWVEAFAAALEDADRADRDLSVVMFDLDHFK